MQLFVLLESASAPCLSISLGTFFLNFIQSTIFLSLAGVDNEDNDPKSTTRPDIQYKFKSPHASPFWLLAILKPTISIISIHLCTTSSTLHLLAFLESTVPSFSSPLRTFFVIFFFSPVDVVGGDTDFHLIDQRKVGYLYHLQMLLFNLQGDNNINGVNNETISVMP